MTRAGATAAVTQSVHRPVGSQLMLAALGHPARAAQPGARAMAGDYWPTACPVESDTLPLQATEPSADSRPNTSAPPK
jgi:hypothetical protein